jgi:ParB family chromosome partitioning protein
LIENLQRENLNAIEEATAYKALITEYKLTQEEVSSRIGKSRSAVANSMRLLDLPNEVAEMVKKGELSAGNARALLGLVDKSGMVDLAKKVVAKGMSVRLTEELVRLMNKRAKETSAIDKKEQEFKVDYVAALEKRVTSHIGRRVKIHSAGKRKKIELEYTDTQDLENILKALCGQDFFDDEN